MGPDGQSNHDIIDHGFPKERSKVLKVTNEAVRSLLEVFETSPGSIHKSDDPVAGFGFGFDLPGEVYSARVRSDDKNMADVSTSAANPFQDETQPQSTCHYREGGKYPKNYDKSWCHHPNPVGLLALLFRIRMATPTFIIVFWI